MEEEGIKITNKDLLANEGDFTQVDHDLVRGSDSEKALWLKFLISKYRYFQAHGKVNDNGDFYFSKSWIEERLGISLKVQTGIIKFWENESILEVYQYGALKRNFYKININKYIEFKRKSRLEFEEKQIKKYNLKKIATKRINDSDQKDQLDGPKRINDSDQKDQYNNINNNNEEFRLKDKFSKENNMSFEKDSLVQGEDNIIFTKDDHFVKNKIHSLEQKEEGYTLETLNQEFNDKLKQEKNNNFEQEYGINQNTNLVYNKESICDDEKEKTTENGETLRKAPRSPAIAISDQQITTVLPRPKIKLESPNSPPAHVKEIVALWSSLGFPKHREGTKLFNQVSDSIKSLINGTFFNSTTDFLKYSGRKFTVEEIKAVIIKYGLVAHNPDYSPPQGDFKKYLSKISLTTFFYNGKSDKNKSFFIKYLENDPILLTTQRKDRKDQFPELTEMVKRVYKKEILGGAEVDFSYGQNQHFVLCSILLQEFFDKNRSKIGSNYLSGGNRDKAGYLISAIIHDVGEANFNRISTGWLCSSETFTRRLPGYLHFNNILRS